MIKKGCMGYGHWSMNKNDFRKARRRSTGVEATKSLTMGCISVNAGLQFQRLRHTHIQLPWFLAFPPSFYIRMNQHHGKVILFWVGKLADCRQGDAKNSKIRTFSSLWPSNNWLGCSDTRMLWNCDAAILRYWSELDITLLMMDDSSDNWEEEEAMMQEAQQDTLSKN